jgi:hypothetical protein
MTENNETLATRLSIRAVHSATDEELSRLKALSEDDLLRACTSLDLFAVVESSRRLKEALHKEERAIKRLTVVLVILTVILVVLTAFLVVPEIKSLLH